MPPLSVSLPRLSLIHISYGEWKTDYTGNITPTGTALPLPYTATPGIVVELPWIMQLHETYTISPTWLNSFAVGMTRLSIPIYEVTQNGDGASSAMAAGGYPQAAGLRGPGLPLTGQGATGFPGITFSGNNVPASWSGTGAFNEWENHYVVQDTMQWVRRDHIISFGPQLELEQDNTCLLYTSRCV